MHSRVHQHDLHPGPWSHLSQASTQFQQDNRLVETQHEWVFTPAEWESYELQAVTGLGIFAYSSFGFCFISALAVILQHHARRWGLPVAITKDLRAFLGVLAVFGYILYISGFLFFRKQLKVYRWARDTHSAPGRAKLRTEMERLQSLIKRDDGN